jgi:hypothetical protein
MHPLIINRPEVQILTTLLPQLVHVLNSGALMEVVPLSAPFVATMDIIALVALPVVLITNAIAEPPMEVPLTMNLLIEYPQLVCLSTIRG